MILRSIRLLPYSIPLDPPFRWRAGEVAERAGVLVHAEDEAGRVGWGDAAPLPGFSGETLGQASLALREALPVLDGMTVDWRAGADPRVVLDAALASLDLPASARYALELALAELAAGGLGMSLSQVLSAAPAGELAIAALLDGDPDSVVDAAARKAAEGYRALKVKLGRLDPESDAEVVRDVRRRVGSRLELRGDANRAWTPDQAAAFARRTAASNVSYVEEPLAPAHLADLGALARETGLRVALDETLAEPGGGEDIESWVEAVVLKPTVLGGISATLRIAERAREAGARSVLSAAFESGVGQRGVAALAASTGGEAVGLDPYVRLRGDVLTRPLPFDRPLVDVPELFGRPVEIRAAFDQAEIL